MGGPELIIVLTVFGLGGGIGAMIGARKGRGGWGFVLGAALGFVGWIIVAVMRPKPGQASVQPARS